MAPREDDTTVEGLAASLTCVCAPPAYGTSTIVALHALPLLDVLLQLRGIADRPLHRPHSVAELNGHLHNATDTCFQNPCSPTPSLLPVPAVTVCNSHFGDASTQVQSAWDSWPRRCVRLCPVAMKRRDAQAGGDPSRRAQVPALLGQTRCGAERCQLGGAAQRERDHAPPPQTGRWRTLRCDGDQITLTCGPTAFRRLAKSDWRWTMAVQPHAPPRGDEGGASRQGARAVSGGSDLHRVDQDEVQGECGGCR